MIQRRQTAYLLLAVAATAACLCLPIGRLEPRTMGVDVVWYNMGLLRDGELTVRPMPFVALFMAGVLAFSDIFLYRRRRVQARLCVVGVALCVAWCIYYAVCALLVFPSDGTFHVSLAALLPLAAVVLLLMARHGIIADERLVRSMDRIR